MSGSPHLRRGGLLRGLAWLAAALGAAALVTFLFATRGGAIQEELQETGERVREKLPELPDLPELPKWPKKEKEEKDAGQAAAEPKKGAEPAKPARPEKPAGPSKKPEKPAYTLKNPPPVAKARHKVRGGETLYSLAETYYEDGSLWNIIAEANGIKDPAELKEGMIVVIPGR